MAFVHPKAKDLKAIEELRQKHGQSVESHGRRRRPPPPHATEVRYVPRPAREDPSEPFQPWHRNLRECTQWDRCGHRFLVSIFDGGLGAVYPKPPARPPAAGQDDANDDIEHLPHEQVLVPHGPRPGLSNLGLHIDYARNRVLCCASDKFNYSLSTVVAYDYTTWETLFVVELPGGEADNKSLADDLASDPDGNMYVTDNYNGRLWKVKSDGSEVSIFCDHPLFHLDPVNTYYGWTHLNGILYHPKGFLLVTHMCAHALLKVSLDAKTVTKVGGLSLELLGDGMALVGENKMVLCGMDTGVHILVTRDDWETAEATENSPAPSSQILPTSVTFKDGHPFVGFAKLDVTPYNSIAQPVFVPHT